jgi:cytochrome c oxidase subunit 2
MIDRLMPIAGSSQAAALDAVLRDIHVHMAAIGMVWATVLIYALFRFRSKANPEPRAEGPRGLWPALAIGAVVLGDVVILATQALPAWSARLAPPDDPVPLEIRVIAERFAWNIHYPGPDQIFGRTDPQLISASNPVGIDRNDSAARDDIGLLNILTLPVNRTVVIQLSSRDAIHSFTLPEMRVKQDATPGLISRVWFTPAVVGGWEIACSQLCGLGHYRMRGEYKVLPAPDWNEWLAAEEARLAR